LLSYEWKKGIVYGGWRFAGQEQIDVPADGHGLLAAQDAEGAGEGAGVTNCAIEKYIILSMQILGMCFG